MADTKTFNTTPEKLANLSTLLAGHDVIFNPNQPTGRAVAQGWDIGWDSPQAGRTAVTVYKHPFAEEGFLWSNLGEILGDPVA